MNEDAFAILQGPNGLVGDENALDAPGVFEEGTAKTLGKLFDDIRKSTKIVPHEQTHLARLSAFDC